MSRPAVAKRFGDGSVYWYKNEGSTEKAKLAAGQQLVGASQFGFDFSKYKPGMWGVRVKVCVTDWNGDGQLDLLLGDRGGEMVESEGDDEPKKFAMDSCMSSCGRRRMTSQRLLIPSSDPRVITTNETGPKNRLVMAGLQSIQGLAGKYAWPSATSRRKFRHEIS